MSFDLRTQVVRRLFCTISEQSETLLCGLAQQSSIISLYLIQRCGFVCAPSNRTHKPCYALTLRDRFTVSSATSNRASAICVSVQTQFELPRRRGAPLKIAGDAVGSFDAAVLADGAFAGAVVVRCNALAVGQRAGDLILSSAQLTRRAAE